MVEQVLAAKSSIALYYIEGTAVEENVKKLSNIKLSPVPGTMKLHQVVSKESQKIAYRAVSCFCKLDSVCSCYNPSHFKFTAVTNDFPPSWLPDSHHNKIPATVARYACSY